MSVEACLEANRKAWDEWASIHMQGTSSYPVDEFKAGKKGWAPNLPDDIGDVKAKSVLHLQCHFGMDTLMWARQEAHVTGVDFSGTAIRGAVALNNELRMEARFVQSDIYALPDVLAAEFDIVLTYYGVLPWLPDLARWAEIVARYIKPGGFLYVADTHPLAYMLEVGEGERFPHIAYPYFSDGEPERCEPDGGTYAAPDAQTANLVTYEWKHPMEEIINAIVDAGLTIEYLHEFPYTFYNMFYYTPTLTMEEDAEGWWRILGMDDRLPLMFSLKACRRK